jgi:hypothetical protein
MKMSPEDPKIERKEIKKVVNAIPMKGMQI